VVSYINRRFKSLAPSATLAVKQKATELKALGRSIIDLSTGEPDIDTPDHIKEAALQAMSQGKTKYTAVPGIPELRKELATYYSKQHQVTYTDANTIVCNGGKQAIYQFLSVVLEQGDEVIVPAPYWVSYPPMVELAGGVPRVVSTKATDRYLMTPELLEKSLNPRTRVVILNSPSNPTGMGYSREHLSALGEVLRDAIKQGKVGDHLLILSDEVYEKLTFSHFSFCSVSSVLPDLQDRLVTVSACSKTFSMTGWRVGWALGPTPLISAMSKYQSQTTSNVCSIAQYAGLAALRGPLDFLDGMIASFARRTELARANIAKIPGLSLHHAPDGAFYLFPRIDELCESGKVKDSVDFASRLLELAGVAIVPGTPFGDDRAFRMSTASSDENIAEGLRRLAEATARIREEN
jgi:aspartate aminotransferase